MSGSSMIILGGGKVEGGVLVFVYVLRQGENKAGKRMFENEML